MSQKRVHVRQQWFNARAMSNFAEVYCIGDKCLARNPNDMVVLQGMARSALEQGEGDKALPWLRTMLETEPNNLEAAYHLWHTDPDDAKLSGLQRADIRLLEHIQEKQTHGLDRFRHVSICGVSYSGSTLLDRMLGGLEGIATIGESHWLTKHQVQDGSFVQIAMDTDLETAEIVPCSVCGRQCKVLTDDLRLELTANATDWYQRIAGALGTHVLISADKNLPKLVNNDPMLRFDALIMFKSPEQAWRSTLNKLPADQDEEYYIDQCKKYIDVWTRSYRKFLYNFNPRGKKIYLNFDAFTRAPEKLFRKICEILNLPFSASVLHRTLPGHAIGGNRGSMQRLREANYRVNIEELPDADLPIEHQDLIDAAEELNLVYRELLEMHDSMVEGKPVFIKHS